MRRTAARAAGLLALLALPACALPTETAVSRTATEQLLVSRAVDHAAQSLVLPLERGLRVHVDARHLTGDGAAYAASALRQAVSAAGYALADGREDADAVLEVRAGALSLEQMRRLVGLPAMALPVTETLHVVSLPELSLYSRRDRVGVAEFSGFLYEARTGRPLGAIAPLVGQHRIRSHKLLMVVNWGQQTAEPGETETDPAKSWLEW